MSIQHLEEESSNYHGNYYRLATKGRHGYLRQHLPRKDAFCREQFLLNSALYALPRKLQI
jgi:hypothetical protein